MARSTTKAAAQDVNFSETLKANGHDAQPSAAPVGEDDFDLKSFLKMAGVNVPSWKRSLITAIACFATGYLIGSVAAVVLDTLMIATAMATGSMFLVACVYILGMIVALYAVFVASRKVAQYIMSGSVDQDIATVKGWFKFGGKKEPIVAA